MGDENLDGKVQLQAWRKSNDSLPPVGWLKATCGLTACTPGSALGPTLGNEYGNFTFTFTFTADLNGEVK